MQGKPAAERTGLLSSDARLQPSARGRLRAADCYAIEFAAKHLADQRLRPAVADAISGAKSPQPSGWVCDAEEKPSARGRLRAAGPDGPILQTIIPPK